MSNVAQNLHARPKLTGLSSSKRSNLHVAPPAAEATITNEDAEYTLFDAARGELAMAAKFGGTDAERVKQAVENVEAVLEACEQKIASALALAALAEEKLGPAALAFARMDALVGGDVAAKDRAVFSVALGSAIASLRYLPAKLGEIAKKDR